jgi:gamma-glutamyltranspeptidase/glutathione hydrolase
MNAGAHLGKEEGSRIFMKSSVKFFYAAPKHREKSAKIKLGRKLSKGVPMRKFCVALLSLFVLAAQAPFSNPAGQQTQDTKTGLSSERRLHRQTVRALQGSVITTGPFQTQRVGMDMLDRGGSAVDAALASALARITLDMGRIVSYAGIFLMVYYEAGSGRVYSLNACFKTPREEHDPLSVSRSAIPNGRAVLVPGFMAGVQAAHDRFGRLPFADIFQPAIEIAENGFPLAQWMIEAIRENWGVLGILPETRNVFLKRRYGLFRGYEPGDLFVQPELAQTLRQVASQGAGYMYTGDWARKFVDIVRQEGGQLTLRDMEEYRPVWADPNHTTYNGYDVHALGSPSLGAMMVIFSINMMEWAGLMDYPHASVSADALYRLMYSSRTSELLYPPYAPEVLETYIPEGDFSYASLADKENARLIWDKIASGEWPEIERRIVQDGYSPPSHSEAIIAVDAQGNVAAVCHTINVDNWGNTGIFVDGVSIPGPGSEQQHSIGKIGPGEYLPDTTNPVLVLRNGVPVFASSSIGSDLHSATVQNLYNMLNFDMSMSESRATPKFQSIDSGSLLRQKVQNGQFPQNLLNAVQAMGLPIVLVNTPASEFWIGLRLSD